MSSSHRTSPSDRGGYRFDQSASKVYPRVPYKAFLALHARAA